MRDDLELLRRYSEDGSEEAFGEFVRRHLPLVFSVARRRVGGDAHLAEDVTQRVFTDLARKAGSLSRHRALTGWLFISARFAAAEAVRREKRRRSREQETLVLHEIQPEPLSPDDWEPLRPSLDDLVNELGTRDREAVLLRFFEGLPFAAIGARLGLSENAARMRVDRALDKLRARLASRGVTSTATALGLVLAGQSSVAVPPGLAITVAGSAAAGGAATGGASALWQFITMNKLTLGIVGAVAAAGIVTSTGITRSSAGTAPSVDISAPEQRSAPEPNPVPPAAVPEAAAEKGNPPAPATGPTIEAATPRVFAPSQLDRQPTPVTQEAPVYPFEAKRAGLTGRVLVDFVVDANGSVRDAAVIEPSTRLFAQAALVAVGRWTYQPGRKDGHPVATHLRVPIEFAP